MNKALAKIAICTLLTWAPVLMSTEVKKKGQGKEFFKDSKLGISIQYSNQNGQFNKYETIEVPTLKKILMDKKVSFTKNLQDIINEMDGANQVPASYKIAEQSQNIQKYLSDYYNVKVERDVINYQLVKRALIDSTSKNGISSTFSQGAFLLNFDQKILLARDMGSLYSGRYNYNRAEEGSQESKGIVEIDQLNISLNNPQELGGVCRDIAVAQAQILDGLGVDNNYVVAFGTIDGGHATMVTEDVNNPGRLIHLNYGELTSNNYQGPVGLRQNTSIPDTAIFYRVFNAKGKAVANIPSELGQALIEMTNGNLKEYDPGLSESNINSSVVSYGNENYEVKGFYSESLAGDKYMGAAVSAKIGGDGDDQNYEVSGGIAASNTTSSRGNGSLETNLFFARLKLGLQTNYYKLPFSTKVRAEAVIQATGMIGNSSFINGTYSKDGSSTDGGVHAKVGVRSKWGNDKYKGETSLHVYSSIQKSDVRDEDSHSIQLSSVALRNYIKTRVTDNYDAGVSNTIIKRPMGTNMMTSVIVEAVDGKGVYEVGIVKTITGKTPSWLPEGKENAFIKLDKRLPGGFSANIKYVRYFKSKEDLLLMQVEKKF